MTEQEITNWLGFGLAVAWFCKIGFHFVYLKAVDKNIKELNFISFYLNFSNFFNSFLIIAPLFFSKTGSDGQKVKAIKWRARISTYVLWTMFVLMGFYLYAHPPKTESTKIEYDFTKDGVQ